MRASFKDFFRTLAANKGKFISVFFIILLGAAFFSGLRSSERDMLLSAEKYYDDSGLYDYRVISTVGLTETDVGQLLALPEVAGAEGAYSMDVLFDETDNLAVKLMSYSDTMNIPTVTEGRLPESADECLVDSFLREKGTYNLGDKVRVMSGDGGDLSESLAYTEMTIVGFGNLPQYMDLNRGSGSVGSGEIEGFVLVERQAFTSDVYTEIYLTLEGAKETDSFESAYDQLAAKGEEAIEGLSESACARRYDELFDAACEEIKAQLGLPSLTPEIEEMIRAGIPQPQWYVLGRDAIISAVNFESDAGRVASLGKLLPIIFFLVAALVSLTAMTRMVEEDRQQIGTLKALGSSNAAIMARYILYALLPTLTGSVIGVLFGEKVFPLAIMKAYSLLYEGLTSYVIPYNLVEGLIAVLASVLVTGLATVFACYSVSHAKPAEIMRPEAPKPGKRVLIERIPFLWKRLNFTQKATVRNMFRYKKRLFMTIIGVAGCMGLVLVGLGLHDSIMVVADKQFEEITHYQATVTITSTLADGERSDLEGEILSVRDGVSALVMYQQTVDAQGDDGVQTITLAVPQTTDGIEDYFTFRERTTRKALALSDDGVIISEKTAKTLGVGVGDSLSFMDADMNNITVTISAIFENYIGHYIFMTEAHYEKLFGGTPQYNQIILRYADTSDEFQDGLGNALLALDDVQGVAFVSTTVKWANDTLSSLNTIVLIVLGSAALLALVVLYNLNSINIAERQREIATLKVLGFYDNEVASYVYRENILLTVIGVIFGIFVGILLHQYVIASIEVDMIMFGRSISWLSYIYGTLITLGFSLIVNLVMYRSLKKIDMLKSLKSIE